MRGRIHSTQKINDMTCHQLISDPSTFVKNRAQRSDDSIRSFLRHMDDVVGTGPEEHLMSDFEHMKTSLHLTDVVVLRNEGNTVSLMGLEITKTSKGFEVKNSTDLVESLLNLHGLQNSKPTVKSRQTFDSDGARVSNSSGWSRSLQLSNSRRKNSSSWHLGDQTCNLPSNNYPHKSSHPAQRASAQ